MRVEKERVEKVCKWRGSVCRERKSEERESIEEVLVEKVCD